MEGATGPCSPLLWPTQCNRLLWVLEWGGHVTQGHTMVYLATWLLPSDCGAAEAGSFCKARTEPLF